jgi:hypothetical protein
MKATYKVSDKMLIEIEGKSQKDLFKGIASAIEVFGEKSCGSCSSGDIILRVRTVDENDFYEQVCLHCRATLKFGQHKKGDSLFPNRKNDDDTYSKTKGWHKFVPEPKTDA